MFFLLNSTLSIILAQFPSYFRLNSLSNAEGNKAQLMQDLEAKIVAANAAKQGGDSYISQVSAILQNLIIFT